MLAFTDKIIEPLATGVSSITKINKATVEKALQMEERNFLTVAVIDIFGKNNRIFGDNFFEENLMKGALLYGAGVLVDTTLYGRKFEFDPFKIADQVAFNSLGMMGLELINIDRFMPQTNNKLYTYLASSAVITGMDMIGDEIYNMPELRPLKMVGTTIGKIFNWI